MTRPGPRPYECVRRAWHSDRHQPLRGSLIQEIFRIANEIHSPATKKNKEWQEKLPVVVLKAEEIMYSKANSEAEYMDLKTLRDRAHDAINTIIRRDESSEGTGEFLLPCIEAALHLGCIPRRTSRSQRNNQPGCYLSGNVDLGNATERNPRRTSPLALPYLSLLRKETPPNSVIPINSCIYNEMPFLSCQECLSLEPSFPSKPFPIFPLYYGVHSQPMESQEKLGPPSTSSFISQDHRRRGIPQRLPLGRDDVTRRGPSEVLNNSSNSECDLSLRLGLASMQKGEDASSRSFKMKNSIISFRKESKEGFSLFDGNNSGSRGEPLDVEMMTRKRKAVEQIKDQHCSWQPKPFGKSNDQHYPCQAKLVPRTRTPGL